MDLKFRERERERERERGRERERKAGIHYKHHFFDYRPIYRSDNGTAEQAV